MKTLNTFLIVMLLSLCAWAQDTNEAPWNFTVSGGISNIANASTNNGFATVTELRVAQHWAARGAVFNINTPNATEILASPEYIFSAAHLLKNSQFAVNASKIEFFAHADLGAARPNTGSATPAPWSFAYGIGGGMNILLSPKVVMRPLDVTWTRTKLAQGQNLVLGNYAQAAAYLGLRW